MKKIAALMVMFMCTGLLMFLCAGVAAAQEPNKFDPAPVVVNKTPPVVVNKVKPATGCVCVDGCDCPSGVCPLGCPAKAAPVSYYLVNGQLIPMTQGAGYQLGGSCAGGSCSFPATAQPQYGSVSSYGGGSCAGGQCQSSGRRFFGRRR